MTWPLLRGHVVIAAHCQFSISKSVHSADIIVPDSKL